MVNLVSYSFSGLKNWLLQRISAIVIMLYSLFIFTNIFSVSSNNYYTWIMLFQNAWVKIFTILAFVALIVHAWTGMWIILTDYIKCKYLSNILQVSFVVGYCICFIWLIYILLLRDIPGGLSNEGFNPKI